MKQARKNRKEENEGRLFREAGFERRQMMKVRECEKCHRTFEVFDKQKAEAEAFLCYRCIRQERRDRKHGFVCGECGSVLVCDVCGMKVKPGTECSNCGCLLKCEVCGMHSK